MRAFLHQDNENEYLSVNFAIAAQGFKEMGWELIGYQSIEAALPQLSREDIVLDFMDESEQALESIMQKCLIWDFDGTLGHRDTGWTGALVEVLRRQEPDCAATADHLRPHIQMGFPWHDPHRPYYVKSAHQWWEDLNPVFERAYTAVGVTAPQAQRLAREVRHAYTAPTHWRLYEDTLPALTQLSAEGWTHLLLSNHVPELHSLLEHLQISQFFTRVFNSAETGYEKPHLQAYRNVLNAIGNAEAVWIIGDSVTADIAGAAAAGIPGILVRKHHVDAVYQCNDLSQVSAIL